MINAARYLGASVNSTGSSPIARKASISSVTTIVPTSAAIADAVRPLTASAVISAPNSLVKLIATQIDDELQRAEAAQFRRALQRQDVSDAEGHDGRHRQRVGADREHLLHRRAPSPPPANDRRDAWQP